MSFAFGFILGLAVGAIAAIVVCCIFRPSPRTPQPPQSENNFYRRKIA